jgi:hypothetical protein
MPVRAELSAVAWPPPLMVVVTVVVAVEMTEIEPVTRPVLALITSTELEFSSAPVPPVSCANHPIRALSATPTTPIGDVVGVGDRLTRRGRS